MLMLGVCFVFGLRFVPGMCIVRLGLLIGGRITAGGEYS
jgi:hypothetical protein